MWGMEGVSVCVWEECVEGGSVIGECVGRNM